jgi:hypothetical protein
VHTNATLRVCQNIGQPSIIASINGFRFFKKFTLS